MGPILAHLISGVTFCVGLQEYACFYFRVKTTALPSRLWMFGFRFHGSLFALVDRNNHFLILLLKSRLVAGRPWRAAEAAGTATAALAPGPYRDQGKRGPGSSVPNMSSPQRPPPLPPPRWRPSPCLNKNADKSNSNPQKKGGIWFTNKKVIFCIVSNDQADVNK